jgi:EAL domain-containing protein (putative c-di-GMP-specific phosphodiesterase class I)
MRGGVAGAREGRGRLAQDLGPARRADPPTAVDRHLVPSALAEEARAAAGIGAIVLALTLAALAYAAAQLWWSPPVDATVGLPAVYVVAALGAGTCAFLLGVRARTLGDGATRWLATGIAVAGLAALGQGLALLDLALEPFSPAASNAATLYLVWHVALFAAIVGAVTLPERTGVRRGGATVLVVVVVVALWQPAWSPVPSLVDAAGAFTSTYRATTLGLAAVGVAVTGWWVVLGGRRPSRVQAWVAVTLSLACLDLLLTTGAERFFDAMWWSSASARAASFALPAAGLLADAGRSLQLLHLHERSLSERLQLELDRATRSVRPVSPAGSDAGARIRTVLESGAIRCRYQPVYSLSTGRLVAVEALARFPDGPGRPPDVWFREAHAVGLGVPLELAALTAAFTGAEQLPPRVALSVNVSPAVLVRPELAALIAAYPGRTVVVEVTEHAAVDDYQQLAECVATLRQHGARLAVDDAGAGFASMRHIVRLVPDVIKLDMTLTRDIHLDPVRRSLAASLVSFAEQIGSVLVAEGVEQAEELRTWQELGAHAAQGYLLGRPAELPAPARCAEVAVPDERTVS